MDFLGSPNTVHLVPWLRRQRVHVPPAFASEPSTLNLASIQQYAQNLSPQEWERVAAQLRGVCTQHGWGVVDALPVDIVTIPTSPADPAPADPGPSEPAPSEEVAAPQPEEIIEVPAEEAPKRRRKVVRVKRVTNKKK